jgi:TP901 family phage tail tape measure protein
MADIQSNISVNIDTSDALASLKALQGQISAFHRDMSKSGALAAAEMSKLQNSLMNSLNRSGQFDARLKTIKTTTESFTEALEKNKLSMGQYFKYGVAATKDFGKVFTNEFDTIEKVARERVKDLQTQYIKMGRDANGAMKAISIRPLMLDLNDASTKMQIAAQKQQILNQLIKQGSTQMLNWGKNTQWAGRQLMVGFTVPLTMVGQIAAKTFMQMEESVIKFQRVYGDFSTTTQQTKEMTTEITNLAKAYTKYGVAVSDTMSMAADAAAMGKMGEDLKAQVKSATELAVLGGIDQKQALETTISLTNAFGISADQLTNKINFLNVVENQTVTSISDLTEAIPKAAPVIKQLGGNVEDLAFFLTAMKEGGINASEGANALKSGIASIINPTKKASDMLAGFGINIKGIVNKNKGDVRGMVMGVAEALNQLDPLKRAQAIEQLFGKFQFARISTLFKNITDVNSQASKVAALAAQGPEASAILAQRELKKIEESPMFKFKKALEDLKVQLVPLGEQFLKIVTPIAEFVRKALEGFNSLSDGVKGTVGNIALWLGGIGPIAIMTIGLIANGIANMIKIFATVKSFMNGLGRGTQDLGSQTAYMTSQQVEAAAVAASLDQVHAKLRQTFTSEAGAVALLRSEMEKAIAKQREFGWTPGTTGAAPKTGGRRKMATGGMVVGPGGPKDDLVPTDLSNGEAVIDAETVKKNPRIIGALFAGKKINIPGYASNNSRTFKSTAPVTESTPSQYETVFAHIAEPIAMSLEDFAKRLTELGKKVPADIQRKLDAGLGKATIRTYGGFGFDTKQSYNDAMKTGGPGVVPKDFLKDFEGRGLDKWKTSIKVAGLNMEDVSEELTQLDKSIADQVRNAQKLDKNFVVTDKAIAEFTEIALKPLREKGSQLAAGFDRARNTVTEVRGNATQGLLSGAGFQRNKERGAGYYTGPNGETVKAGRLVKIGGGAKGKTSRGVLGGATMEDFAVQGIMESTDQASPSKKAKKAGENIGVGALQGLEEVAKKAKATVRTQAQQDATVIASRTRSAYKNDAELKNLSIRMKQAEMMGANTAAIEQEIKARKAVIAAEVKNAVASESAARVTAATSRSEAARKGWETRRANAAAAAKAANPSLGSRIGGGFKKMGSSIMGSVKGMGGMGAGMGVMMGMGALTQVPGKVGEVAQGLMGPVSAAASAMMMIPGPAGIAVGAIAGLAMGAMQLKAAFDEAQAKAVAFAKNTGASADAIKGIAEASGKVSSGEIMDKRRETSMNAFKFSKETNAVAEGYVASEAGKASISAVTEAMKNGGGQAAVSNMVSQMTSAVASGAISAIDAKAVVEKIGQELGDQTFALKVTAQMDSLIGPDGGKLESDAVGTRKNILQSGSLKNLSSSASNLGNVSYDNSGARTGLGAGAVAGAAIGSVVPVVGTAVGAAAGALIGGITGGIVDMVNYFGQIGTSSGAFASNLVIAEQNTQEMVDSLQLQYEQRIANAKAAGDEAEASRLQKEYEQGRLDILQQSAKAIGDAAANYENFSVEKKTAVIGSLDTQIKDLYKEGPMKAIAEDAINKIGANTADGSQAELVIKTSIASGDIDPQTLNSTLDMFANQGKGEAGATLVADMILKSGSAETDRMLQIAGMASSGEKQTATLEALGNMDPNQQQQTMSTLERVGQYGGQQALTISVDTLGTEEGLQALTDLQTKYDSLDKLFKGKGPITMEMITKTSGFEDVQMDAAWFNKLPKSQQKVAMNAYLTVKETIDAGTPEGKARIKEWYAQKHGNTYVLDQGYVSYASVANDMANEAAQNAASTQAAIDKQGGNTPNPNGNGTPKTASDKANAALSILGKKEEAINKAYDKRLKALDEIQAANERINQQKKDQLDLADALSKGDIGAAAKAQQAARETAQANALQEQRDSMNVAKEAQLASLKVNGMTRAGLEAFLARQENKTNQGTLGGWHYATGGLVPNRQYFALGGKPKGTDTIAAMLTPGEFVVKKSAVDAIGHGNMQKINRGQLPTSGHGSMYNYSININVKSDADPNQIAKTVIAQIERIENQSMKGDKH